MDEPLSDRDLIRAARKGDDEALATLFERYRPRLFQMVRIRLHPRLQGRIDPSDVLQEAYLDIVEQFPNYVQKRSSMSPFIWLRLVTGQRLARIHRMHLGAEMRDAGREISIHRGAFPRATSISIAAQLLGRLTSVSQAVVRAEMRAKLQEAVNAMDEIDREIIALRHFEELTNREVAELLNLSKSATSNRYIRALARLQQILQDIPGFMDEE